MLATLLAILLQRTSARSPAALGLYTASGERKYLNGAERRRFAVAARAMPADVRAFCLLLMWSGCRISEALALTPVAIDRAAGTAAFLTLKRRAKIVVRQVPIPREVIEELSRTFDLSARERDPYLRTARLWRWSRSTGWRHVKAVMRCARLSGGAAMPKGLRHTFGVAAFETVPPHLVQRWLGHASLRTTAIYGDVSGREERHLAHRVWRKW